MADTTCLDCGQPFGMGRRAVETLTGRQICAGSLDDLLAAAAGVIAVPQAPVPSASAARGGFRKLRRRPSV